MPCTQQTAHPRCSTRSRGNRLRGIRGRQRRSCQQPLQPRTARRPGTDPGCIPKQHLLRKNCTLPRRLPHRDRCSKRCHGTPGRSHTRPRWSSPLHRPSTLTCTHQNQGGDKSRASMLRTSRLCRTRCSWFQRRRCSICQGIASPPSTPSLLGIVHQLQGLQTAAVPCNTRHSRSPMCRPHRGWRCTASHSAANERLHPPSRRWWLFWLSRSPWL